MKSIFSRYVLHVASLWNGLSFCMFRMKCSFKKKNSLTISFFDFSKNILRKYLITHIDKNSTCIIWYVWFLHNTYYKLEKWINFWIYKLKIFIQLNILTLAHSFSLKTELKLKKLENSLNFFSKFEFQEKSFSSSSNFSKRSFLKVRRVKISMNSTNFYGQDRIFG